MFRLLLNLKLIRFDAFDLPLKTGARNVHLFFQVFRVVESLFHLFLELFNRFFLGFEFFFSVVVVHSQVVHLNLQLVDPVLEFLLDPLYSPSDDVFAIVDDDILAEFEGLSVLLYLLSHLLFIAQGEVVIFLSQLSLNLLAFPLPALPNHKHILLHFT